MINPGDHVHTLQGISIVVSGDDYKTLKTISNRYASIVPAGVYETSSIRVAEAAEVIENTQHDLNIALVNELSMILDRLGLNTSEVLQAAGSRWNCVSFTLGLVGGHCIRVDPYYLMYKAQETGYEPQVILAGRRINDEMRLFVAGKTLALLAEINQKQALSVNVPGVTFKDICRDTRNSQVFSLDKHLKDHDIEVSVPAQLADPVLIGKDHGIELVPIAWLSLASALVVGVPSWVFGVEQELTSRLMYSDGVLVDVKSAYRDVVGNRSDFTYWSL